MGRPKRSVNEFPMEPWFPEKWFNSDAFAEMNQEQQGIYRNLLSRAWQRRGLLPSDETKLQALCRATGDEWARSWPVVRRWFIDVQSRNGETFLCNDKQLSELKRAKTIRKEKSVSGANGGKASAGAALRRKQKCSNGTAETGTGAVPPVQRNQASDHIADHIADHVRNVRTANPLVNREKLVSEGYASIAEIAKLTGEDGTEILARNSKGKGSDFRGATRLDTMSDDWLARTVLDLKAELARRKMPPEREGFKYGLPTESPQQAAERRAREARERGSN